MGERAVTRVVVLGAGFAGLAACRELAEGGTDLEVVVVDRHTYNTFQPLLYQVATGGLSPGDIAYAVRSYLREQPGVAFRQGLVCDVDLVAREVLFSGGEASLGYDYLVVATGAATSFFGVPGAESHSHAIYTMEDAIGVRDEVFSLLEKAGSFGSPGRELSFVIVGGGPTGVEMAGTLAELLAAELQSTYSGSDSAARIVLVDQRDRLLGAFKAREARYALGALVSRGVDVRLSKAVASLQPGRVLLAGGEALSADVVIWAAGVSAGPLAAALAVAKTSGGRIEVEPDLRLRDHPEVFVAGDVAGGRDGGGEGPLLPQLAQPAIQEGRHAARQVLRLAAGRGTEPFNYRDKGIMATIGRRAAVAELANGASLRGTPAWLAWLGLHIVFLLGVRNRLAVLLNWAWRYLWWRRGTRVIAGT